MAKRVNTYGIRYGGIYDNNKLLAFVKGLSELK